MASLEQSMASLGIAPKCVSVVIPTRGTKPAALERAVASALGQSRPPDEVVVVFDGPAAPAHAWGPAVRAVALGAHSGGRPGVVRNGGVAAARGDWLAFLDDDDEWAPTKLAEQLQALAADGSDFCCCRAHGDDPADALPRRFAGQHVADRNRVVCSSVLLSRARLAAAGGFGDEPYGQDWRCWQRCLAAGGAPATCVDRALVRLNPDALDLDRSTVRAESRHALRSALAQRSSAGGTDPAAALIASFGGF